MSRIEEIDSNFKVNPSIGKTDVKFYDVLEEPFAVYGVFFQDGQYRRLPEAVAKTVNDGVLELHHHTAGGRVRFRTDSTYVAMHMESPFFSRMSHFPITGSCGLDLYETIDGAERYIRTFVPSVNDLTGYEGVIELGEGMHEVTIHFPLYSQVSALYIGLSESAQVFAPRPYVDRKPIVYYGSSITQGGCASRPGSAYQNILSRHLQWDHINLGFSGSARGEDTMAEYIASLDMSVFVYDYDYNAPSTEHLRNTHERMFKTIRAAHPDIPVVMMTRPKYYPTAEEVERMTIIETTYKNALAAGDKNVYFITGRELMAMAHDEGTVDSCHPTDLGFTSMAMALEPLLAKLL